MKTRYGSQLNAYLAIRRQLNIINALNKIIGIIYYFIEVKYNGQNFSH